MKCWCTIPTPASIDALGEPRRTGFPLIRISPSSGVVEPVEDVHQRRLARAVLAEQRVHLALEEVEADVVVRDDPREALRDVAHLEDLGALGHCARSFASRPTDLSSVSPRRSDDAASARSRRNAAGGLEARPLDCCATSSVLPDGARRLDLARGEVLLPLAEQRVQPARRRLRTVVLTLPKPTPLFFDVEDGCRRRPSTCLALASWIVLEDARRRPSSCALVRMWLPRKPWSASTPMPQSLLSFAACSAPRPQPPATWKTTSASCCDLVQRDLLALVLVDEVLRVAVQRLDARLGLLRAVLVAGDERVDRRDLEAADRADHAAVFETRRRRDAREAARPPARRR